MTFQFLLRVPGQLLPRRLPLDVLMIQSEHLYRLFIPVRNQLLQYQQKYSKANILVQLS